MRSGWRHPPTRNRRTSVYADVRTEEGNRVPLAEETFAASASPPKESNSDTVGAFVKEHLVSFELAGGGGGCLCPRHRRLTPSRLRSRQQNPLKKSPHRSRGIVGGILHETSSPGRGCGLARTWGRGEERCRLLDEEG